MPKAAQVLARSGGTLLNSALTGNTGFYYIDVPAAGTSPLRIWSASLRIQGTRRRKPSAAPWLVSRANSRNWLGQLVRFGNSAR